MLSPLPRRSDWVPTSLTSPAVSAFPGIGAGSACASTFSRPAQRSLALRPAHSRGHQFVTRFTRGFNHFVTSIVAPVDSGWSDCRVGLSPTGKAPPYHGAPYKRTFKSFQKASNERPQTTQKADIQRRPRGREIHRRAVFLRQPGRSQSFVTRCRRGVAPSESGNSAVQLFPHFRGSGPRSLSVLDLKREPEWPQCTRIELYCLAGGVIIIWARWVPGFIIHGPPGDVGLVGKPVVSWVAQGI